MAANEEIKTLNQITTEGINEAEVRLLQTAITNLNDSNDSNNSKILIKELQNGFSKKEIEAITKAITKAITEEDTNKEPYKTLLASLKSLNNNSKEILERTRTPKLAKTAMETNSAQFDKIFTAVGENKNLTQLKNFAINYSDKNKKVENITSITAVTAGKDDENFAPGVKYLNIISTNQENNEIFSFGDANKLADNYINRIKETTKLTGTNIKTKREQYNKDLAGASNAKQTEIFNAFVNKIGTNGSDLKLLLDNISKDDILFSSNKTENTKKLTTAINNSNLSSTEKLKYNKKIKTLMAPKYKEKQGPKNIIEGLTEDFETKFGGIKGVLTKILNMINSNPMLKSMFGKFFDEHEGIQDRLTEGYELDASQNKKVSDIVSAFGGGKMKSIDEVLEKKTEFTTALTDNLNFKKDISQGFKDYMMTSTGKNAKDYTNTKSIISDYMEMIEDKNSPLRKNYEDAMKQLKDDGVKNPDLIQIMTASILNFQQDGEGMKYLWTKNNVESTTNDETQEDIEETPEQKGAKAYGKILASINGIDSLNNDKNAGALLTIYDKILNGKDTDLMAHIKTLDKNKLINLFKKFPAYLTTINDKSLTNTYDNINITDLITSVTSVTSVTFENNELKINNTEINMKPKAFPEDVKAAMDKLNTSDNIDTDHKSMLKAINTNFDEVVVQFKKGLLTGELTQAQQKEFINLLGKSKKNGEKESPNIYDKINNNNVNLDKSSVTIDGNAIKIELKDKDLTTQTTISITEGTKETNTPTFTI